MMGKKDRLLSCSPRVRGEQILLCQEVMVTAQLLRDCTSKVAAQPHLPRVLTHDPLYDAGANAQGSADLEDAVAIGA
jgi:hypothetical protein